MIIPFQFFLLLTNQHFRITADQSDKLPPLTHLIYLRGDQSDKLPPLTHLIYLRGKSNNVSNTFCSFLLVLLLSLGPGGGTTILKVTMSDPPKQIY